MWFSDLLMSVVCDNSVDVDTYDIVLECKKLSFVSYIISRYHHFTIITCFKVLNLCLM